MKKNGMSKQVESLVEAVMEELKVRGDTGAKAAGDAVQGAGEAIAEKARDADLGDKVDRVIDFIEENANVLAQVSKRLASDVAKEAPGAAAAVSEAAGQAAEVMGEAAGQAAEAVGAAAGSAGEAVGDLIETFGEEVIQPTVRYGRGLRHGLLVGAALAILYTPWPGAVVRAKLKNFAREAMDLVDAMRAGAADARS